MTEGKPWASTNNILIVLSECIIIALMTLGYLNPAAAAVAIVLMLGGYLVAVFGPAARSHFAATTGQPHNSAV
jgi:uncharacterized membrane protein YphA (DoxX/SURF4 family)